MLSRSDSSFFVESVLPKQLSKYQILYKETCVIQNVPLTVKAFVQSRLEGGLLGTSFIGVLPLASNHSGVLSEVNSGLEGVLPSDVYDVNELSEEDELLREHPLLDLLIGLPAFSMVSIRDFTL